MSKKKPQKVTRESLRVVTYSRNSVLANNQDEFGNTKTDGTIESQKQKNRNYLQSMFSSQNTTYKILDEIEDDGCSGKDTDRPGFIKLCEYVENQEIDIVVASELSRISRNVKDFLDFMDLCENNNVDVMIIGLQLDTRTHFGKLMLTILVSLAQFEREVTAQRVKDNIDINLISKKKINGASEVLGLVRDLENKEKGHFIPHKEELKTVVQIFKIYLEQPSIPVAAKVVSTLGLTNRNGEPIKKRQIEYMIMNAEWRYRGLWHYNIENRDLDQGKLSDKDKFRLIELRHGAVVDIELLDRVEAKHKEAAKKKTRTGKADYTYLVTKLLSDEEGNPFKVDSSTKDRENNVRHHYYKNKVTRETIHADKIHEMAFKRVEEYFKNEELLDQIMSEFNKREKAGVAPIEVGLRKMKTKLAELEEEERRYLKKLISDEASTSESLSVAIKREIDLIQNEKLTIQNKVKEQECYKNEVLNDTRAKDNLDRIKDLVKGFRKMTGTAQRDYLAKIFHRIVIQKDNKVKFEIKIRKSNISTVTMEDTNSSIKLQNGGRDGTRTRGLLRDRQTL